MIAVGSPSLFSGSEHAPDEAADPFGTCATDAPGLDPEVPVLAHDLLRDVRECQLMLALSVLSTSCMAGAHRADTLMQKVFAAVRPCRDVRLLSCTLKCTSITLILHSSSLLFLDTSFQHLS